MQTLFNYMQQAVATVFGVPDEVSLEHGHTVVAFGSMRIRIESPSCSVAGLAMKLDAFLIDGQWVAAAAQTVQGLVNSTPERTTSTTAPESSVPTPAAASRSSTASVAVPAPGAQLGQRTVQPLTGQRSPTPAERAPAGLGSFAGLARRAVSRTPAAASPGGASRADKPASTPPAPVTTAQGATGATGRPRFVAGTDEEFDDVHF